MHQVFFQFMIVLASADQLIFAKAVVTIAAMNYDDFLLGMMLKENKTEEKRFPELMIVSDKAWASVQAINFYLVPLRCQVAFNCVCAIAWNSLATHTSFIKEWTLKSE